MKLLGVVYRFNPHSHHGLTLTPWLITAPTPTRIASKRI